MIGLWVAIAAAAEPWPPGVLVTSPSTYDVVLYFAPSPTTSPADALAGACASRAALAPVELTKVPATKIPPPDADTVAMAGRGLTAEQAAQVGRSTESWLAHFDTTADPADRVRMADALVACLARETGAIAWDNETQLLYGASAWVARDAGWVDGPPSAQRHVSLHVVREGTSYGLVTEGLAKLGLPDVAMHGVALAQKKPMGALLTAVAQRMIEHPILEGTGEMPLSLDTIKDPETRRVLSGLVLPGAVQQATLSIAVGHAQYGDYNRVIELAFSAADAQEAQCELLDTLFGTKEAATKRTADQARLTSTREVQASLESLRPWFEAGAAPGKLRVQAPFADAHGGVEWLWVQVVTWKGDAIKGILQQDPAKVAGLHHGDTVAVSEGKLRDYVCERPDGQVEGPFSAGPSTLSRP